MRTDRKRLLSLLLAITMIVGMLTIPASADQSLDNEGNGWNFWSPIDTSYPQNSGGSGPVEVSQDSVSKVTFSVGTADFNYATGNGPTSIDGSHVYSGSIQGGNNQNGNKGDSVPTGTYYRFVPSANGVLEVAYKLNANKPFYILKNNIALENYNGIEVTSNTTTTTCIEVEAGAIYDVLCTSSRLQLYGFGFNEGATLAAPCEHGEGTEPLVKGETGTPSCTAGAYTNLGTKCKKCGETLTPSVYANKLGHTFGEGDKCSVCNDATAPTSEQVIDMSTDPISSPYVLEVAGYNSGNDGYVKLDGAGKFTVKAPFTGTMVLEFSNNSGKNIKVNGGENQSVDSGSLTVDITINQKYELTQGTSDPRLTKVTLTPSQTSEGPEVPGTNKKVTVTAAADNADDPRYDGEAHGIVVTIEDEDNEAVPGATVKYGEAEESVTADESPKITNVSDSGKEVFYAVTLPTGYDFDEGDGTGKVTITITKADAPTIKVSADKTSVAAAGDTLTLTVSAEGVHAGSEKPTLNYKGTSDTPVNLSGNDFPYTGTKDIDENTEKATKTHAFELTWSDNNYQAITDGKVTFSINQMPNGVVITPATVKGYNTGKLETLGIAVDDDEDSTATITVDEVRLLAAWGTEEGETAIRAMMPNNGGDGETELETRGDPDTVYVGIGFKAPADFSAETWTASWKEYKDSGRDSISKAFDILRDGSDTYLVNWYSIATVTNDTTLNINESKSRTSTYYLYESADGDFQAAHDITVITVVEAATVEVKGTAVEAQAKKKISPNEDLEITVAAASGKTLPPTISVTINDTPLANTDYTWADSKVTISKDKFNSGDAIVITIDESSTTQKYTVTVNGGTTNKSEAAEGEQVTVTATVPAGKKLTAWTSSDITISPEDAVKTSFTFEMPGKNVTVTADYEDETPTVPTTYTLTVSTVYNYTTDDVTLANGATWGPLDDLHKGENGAAADGGFFYVYHKVDGGSIVQSNNASFTEAQGGPQSICINTQGATGIVDGKISNAITFNANPGDEVKVWYKAGGSNRSIALGNTINANGLVALGSNSVAMENSSSVGVAEFEVPSNAESGTYYIGYISGGMRVYKVQVTTTAKPIEAPETGDTPSGKAVTLTLPANLSVTGGSSTDITVTPDGADKAAVKSYKWSVDPAYTGLGFEAEVTTSTTARLVAAETVTAGNATIKVEAFESTDGTGTALASQTATVAVTARGGAVTPSPDEVTVTLAKEGTARDDITLTLAAANEADSGKITGNGPYTVAKNTAVKVIATGADSSKNPEDYTITYASNPSTVSVSSAGAFAASETVTITATITRKTGNPGGGDLDTSKLEAAIEAAKEAAEAVLVSENGSNVPTSRKWVTEDIMNEFKAAIEAAENALSATTQAAVDNALAALAAAQETFVAAQKNGTRRSNNTNSGGGVPNTPGNTGSDNSNSNNNSGNTTPSGSNTTTTTNPDGSTTTTTTNPNGTVTSTTTATDGTTTTTTTESDGTVTTTKTETDGSKTETVDKPDGSKTETVTRPDGSSTETVTKADGARSEIVKDAAGDVTVTATSRSGEVVAKVDIPAVVPELSYKFEDVPSGHWAERAINTMAALNVVSGESTENHVFNMDSNITRGAMAQILYNLSNGTPGKAESFGDVFDGAWYTDAVAWAANAGVVTGYSDATFGPEDSITREQLAVMLCRYADLLGLNTSASSAALSGFADVSSVSSWSTDAMAWAVSNGLIQGKGANNLDPAASASRAETAVILQRFLDLLK